MVCFRSSSSIVQNDTLVIRTQIWVSICMRLTRHWTISVKIVFHRPENLSLGEACDDETCASRMQGVCVCVCSYIMHNMMMWADYCKYIMQIMQKWQWWHCCMSAYSHIVFSYHMVAPPSKLSSLAQSWEEFNTCVISFDPPQPTNYHFWHPHISPCKATFFFGGGVWNYVIVLYILRFRRGGLEG